MTTEEARDIVLDALATYRHVHVTSAAPIGPDGLVIDFTDGTMGRLDITIYPAPDVSGDPDAIPPNRIGNEGGAS